MKWGLICKQSKRSFLVGKRIYETLGTTFHEHKIAEYLGKKGYSVEEVGHKSDSIVVVGGDGTILTTLQHTTQPIFPINTGRVGFLTEVEAKHTQSALTKLLDNNYYIEERVKLNAQLENENLPDAANEITVHTANVGKILFVELYVDNILTQSFCGDGLIVATPMGSTSYSLSVGGPVVDSTLNVFIIAPIAPFRHIASALIIPSTKKLSIKVKKPAKVVIDGSHIYDFQPHQKLDVFESERKASFIKTDDNFYGKIYAKLSYRYPKSL